MRVCIRKCLFKYKTSKRIHEKQTKQTPLPVIVWRPGGWVEGARRIYSSSNSRLYVLNVLACGCIYYLVQKYVIFFKKEWHMYNYLGN